MSAVMMKSSAYLMRCTRGLLYFLLPNNRGPMSGSKVIPRSCSNPSRVRFANTGEIMPPCGVLALRRKRPGLILNLWPKN